MWVRMGEGTDKFRGEAQSKAAAGSGDQIRRHDVLVKKN